MGTVSIIVPCYWANENLIKITEEMVDSLFEHTEQEFELIIVDDGSPIKMIYPKLHWEPTFGELITLKDNKGFAGAVNAGLERATGDILVIANNDIVLTPNWLRELLKPLERGYDISTVRQSNNSDGTEDKITEGDKFEALWAMKRSTYEVLGKLDERFGRGTFEDTDYRRRALNEGLKVGKNHNYSVKHIGRATFDIVDPDKNSYKKNLEVYRDKHGFIE